MKQTTLCLLIDDNKILLAMKKRGHGAGKWNGVGGKVTVPESIEEAALRETEEEISVRINPNALQKVAVLSFHNDRSDWDQECHVYVSKVWQGEPTESEEMKPQWFTFSGIPYDEMWVDDVLWLPLVLQGKTIEADFYFSNEGKVLERHEIREI